MEKKYCSIHHFKYTGTECPFCLQDRLAHVMKKVEKTEKEEEAKQKVSPKRPVKKFERQVLTKEEIKALFLGKYNVQDI